MFIVLIFGTSSIWIIRILNNLTILSNWHSLTHFYPLAKGVLSLLVASVCLSVCLSVNVTPPPPPPPPQKKKKKKKTCILGYSRLVLKMEVTDFDLQCHFGHFDLEF